MTPITISEDARAFFHPSKYPQSDHKPGNRVSPIARLPDETLQHIFVHSTPSVPQLGFHGINNTDMNVPFPEPDLTQPPLLLTRVCTLWRDVSISTSELWCSLRLCIPHYTHYRGKGELLRAVLETWLRNAKIQPLNIVLHTPERRFSATSPPAPGSLWDYILPVFISHAHHWSTLIASPSIAKYLLGRRVHMPMLRTFSSRDLVYFRSTDVLCLAPRLLSLSVTTFDSRWLLPGGVAQGLQHLSLLCCDTPRDVLSILAYFPKLLSFQLRTCWGDDPGTHPIVHQTLEEFAVPLMMALPCVTNMLTLPSLRIMIVTGDWDASHMESVRLMLSHSSCSLRHLEFSGSPYHDIDAQIGYEIEQLSRFTPRIRLNLMDMNFERPSSSL